MNLVRNSKGYGYLIIVGFIALIALIVLASNAMAQGTQQGMVFSAPCHVPKALTYDAAILAPTRTATRLQVITI